VVAIVDDDPSVLHSIKDLMESGGLRAECFESAEAFLAWDQRHLTTCLVTDLRMPGMSGLELQAHLVAEGSGIPIIVLTAVDDSTLRARALQAGAVGFLLKPCDDELLLKKVWAASKG